MQITEISTSQHRDFVPIKGWEGVEAALNAYNSGSIDGSRATEQKLYDDAGDAGGGMGAALIGLGNAIMEQQKSNFVARMLEQAKPSIADCGSWCGDYDYDGMGTAFFKTTVNIVLLDKDEEVYGISLNAAYVGDKPEVNMATYFEVERGIKQCAVSIEAEPTSADGFTFDFEVILRKLDRVLDTSDISGEEVVAAIMAGDGWNSPSFVLPGPDGYEITLKTDRVGRRMGRVDGEPVDQWSSKDSCLFGNLQQDYGSDDENARLKPTLSIAIKKEGASDYGHDGVIWKTEDQEKIVALSNKIAAALR